MKDPLLRTLAISASYDPSSNATLCSCQNTVIMITRGGRIVSRIERAKIHVLHFRKDALMVFQGLESCPLPPLYSFTMYFTHPDVNQENVQPVQLFKAIREGCSPDHCPFRLELVFLHVPNAEVANEACIAHYREEKRSRGDYTRQIEAIESSNTTSRETSADNLPGLVPSYIDNPALDYYHGLIFSYHGPDWTKDEQRACSICFDPIPQDVYSSIVEGDLGDDEPEILPPVHITLKPIRDTENSLIIPIGEQMELTSHGPTSNVTNGPWQRAIKRGWSTW